MAGLTAQYASLRAYKAGEFAGCLESIDRDLAHCMPEHTRILLFYKANSLYRLARHTEAIPVYRHLLALPGPADDYRLNALLNYGLCALLLDDPELSWHCVDLYTKEPGHDGELSRIWLGVVEVLEGKAQGWEHLRDCLAQPGVRSVQSLQLVGLCCLKANRADMAEQLFPALPEIESCPAEYLLIALYYCNETRDPERAARCITQLGEHNRGREIELTRSYFTLRLAWNRQEKGPGLLQAARELQDRLGEGFPDYLQQIQSFCNTVIDSLGTRPAILVSRRHGIVGDSQPIFELRRSIDKYAPTGLNMLLLGESGTGKELVARALHAASLRSGAPFVAVNCFHLGSNLAEAKLFGYRKGAFSGATADTPGFVQKANGGTLFLDEIGELPPETQANLFRFLDNGIFYPLGSANEERSDIRVIAATNQDLRGNPGFRQELYHRLSGVVLRLPRLVDRGEDLRSLAQYKVQELNTQHSRYKVLSEQALALLANHPFPGNVRELFNVITRAWYSAGHEIRPEHLELVDEIPLSHQTGNDWAPDLNRDQLDFEDLTARYAQRLVRDVHERLGGKVKDTARRLNMSERSVYRWISKPGETHPDSPPDE